MNTYLLPISAISSSSKYSPGVSFTQGFSPDLDLKTFFLNSGQLYGISGSHNAPESKFWLSLSGSGLNFCKKQS